MLTDKMSSQVSRLDKDEVLTALTSDVETLIDTVKTNPSVFNWLLATANQERKYIKIPKETNDKLEKLAKEKKVPAGVLIGMAILLLVAILDSNKRGD